ERRPKMLRGRHYDRHLRHATARLNEANRSKSGHPFMLHGATVGSWRTRSASANCGITTRTLCAALNAVIRTRSLAMALQWRGWYRGVTTMICGATGLPHGGISSLRGPE